MRRLAAVLAGLCLSACAVPSEAPGPFAVCGETSFAFTAHGESAVLEFLGREPLVLERIGSSSSVTYTDGRHTVLINNKTGDISYAAGRAMPRPCSRSADFTALRAVVDAPVTADFAAKPPGDWSRFLADFQPYIRTCLAAAAGDLPRVLIAWPMNHGFVGMRLVNQNGARMECLSDTAKVETEHLAFDAPPVPGEGHPVFTPVTSAPPFHPAYRHERVEIGGELVGWLSYRNEV